MNDFMSTNFPDTIITVSGSRYQRVEAVIVQPTFTYIIETLVALLSLLMGAWSFCSTTPTSDEGLRDDPGIF
jgi:hypothetical protein